MRPLICYFLPLYLIALGACTDRLPAISGDAGPDVLRADTNLPDSQRDFIPPPDTGGGGWELNTEN